MKHDMTALSPITPENRDDRLHNIDRSTWSESQTFMFDQLSELLDRVDKPLPATRIYSVLKTRARRKGIELPDEFSREVPLAQITALQQQDNDSKREQLLIDWLAQLFMNEMVAQRKRAEQKADEVRTAFYDKHHAASESRGKMPSIDDMMQDLSIDHREMQQAHREESAELIREFRSSERVIKNLQKQYRFAIDQFRVEQKAIDSVKVILDEVKPYFTSINIADYLRQEDILIVTKAIDNLINTEKENEASDWTEKNKTDFKHRLNLLTQFKDIFLSKNVFNQDTIEAQIVELREIYGFHMIPPELKDPWNDLFKAFSEQYEIIIDRKKAGDMQRILKINQQISEIVTQLKELFDHSLMYQEAKTLYEMILDSSVVNDALFDQFQRLGFALRDAEISSINLLHSFEEHHHDDIEQLEQLQQRMQFALLYDTEVEHFVHYSNRATEQPFIQQAHEQLERVLTQVKRVDPLLKQTLEQLKKQQLRTSKDSTMPNKSPKITVLQSLASMKPDPKQQSADEETDNSILDLSPISMSTSMSKKTPEKAKKSTQKVASKGFTHHVKNWWKNMTKPQAQRAIDANKTQKNRSKVSKNATSHHGGNHRGS